MNNGAASNKENGDARELQKLSDELMQLRTADALELHQEDRIAEMKEELEALAKEMKQLDALIEPHVCDEDLAEEYGGVRKNQGLITLYAAGVTSPAAYLLIIHASARTSGPLGGCRQLPSAVAAFSAGRRVGASDACSCRLRRLFGVLAWSPAVKPWSSLKTGRLCGGAHGTTWAATPAVSASGGVREGHECVCIPEAQ
ncbi:hypothetical protein HPB50_015035 [Hyalomma asiaticum]|uniref:Uncharacterized protein n=1 Tax=Hyalomma asiaticum TaxID=266040 RepID=A0ACB7SR26_HYAAI|nr:hypothetical protein HPB50_015035 [Hyalomma asiaticum]